MIACPDCGGSNVIGDDDVYANTPTLADIMYIECQDCDAGFDVRITSEGVELDPTLYIPGCGVCTCTTHANTHRLDAPCCCQACPELARRPDGCPHRLDQILAGEASNSRLYEGMCDECFEMAREVRLCGLRVAEHEAVTR